MLEISDAKHYRNCAQVQIDFFFFLLVYACVITFRDITFRARRSAESVEVEFQCISFHYTVKKESREKPYRTARVLGPHRLAEATVSGIN